MSAEWDVLSLEDLCSIKSGKSDTQDAVDDGPYVFFDRSKTIKRSTRYLYDCEALVMPGEGSEFLPRHFVGKFDLHQRAYALFDFAPRIDVRFLYWYLIHQRDYFPRVAVGATVKSLRLRHFQQLQVPVPPIADQKRLVQILESADTATRGARVNTERNARNARAFYESYLESAITNPMESWREIPLGAMATFRNGINYTKGSQGDLVKIVGVGDFQDRYWAPLEKLQAVTVDGALSQVDALAQGDILVVRSNGNPALVGRSVLVGPMWEQTTHSGFTIRLRLSRDDVLPQYLCYFLKSRSTRNKLAESGTGMNIRSLNQTTLAGLTVPVPPASEQADLVRRLDHLADTSRELEHAYLRQVAAIDELRQSFLGEAFSGHF